MVSYLAKFAQAPTDAHWAAVKHVLRYLKQTELYCLAYQMNCFRIEAFCVSNHGSPLFERHSTSGVLIKMAGGGVICYCAKKQGAKAISITEAEYMAACQAAGMLSWLRQFLDEPGAKYESPTLYIDN